MRSSGESRTIVMTARAGDRRFRCLSALRAHTKTPDKTDLHRETLRALNRPGRLGQPSSSSNPGGATPIVFTCGEKIHSGA